VICVTGLTDDVPLRRGYTLAAIHELALVAVRCEPFYRSRNYTERIDLAWSAIVEHLYASEKPPSRRDLIHTGMTAISNWFVSEARTHGVNPSQRGRTTEPGVNFERYWHVFARPTPSPEERIVEHLALAQVWHTLSPRVRGVFGALAVHGEYHQAAGSLSKTLSSFTRRSLTPGQSSSLSGMTVRLPPVLGDTTGAGTAPGSSGAALRRSSGSAGPRPRDSSGRNRS